MKKWVKAIMAVFVLAVALIFVTAAYAGDYYSAVDVDKYMTDSADLRVTEIKQGWFFDGPGSENALIFYPGAKVDETAYAPILRSVSEQGVDCFLMKMPLHLAIFNMDKADEILAEYSYTNYYLAGHSLGGAIAANHAHRHQDGPSGVFLLAAYPTEDLTASPFPIVFIYGDCDTVLNREELKAGFELCPESSLKIEIAGGNHAQFGSYGDQKGDSEATITPEEQWQITVETILDTINQ